MGAESAFASSEFTCANCAPKRLSSASAALVWRRKRATATSSARVPGAAASTGDALGAGAGLWCSANAVAADSRAAAPGATIAATVLDRERVRSVIVVTAAVPAGVAVAATVAVAVIIVVIAAVPAGVVVAAAAAVIIVVTAAG